jgi:lipoprotein-anchoring transpeptidase ErfK/SrfK
LPVRKKPAQKTGLTTGLLIAGGAILTVFVLTLMVVGIGALFLFGGNTVLPGVRVAGIPLGGMNQTEAEAALAGAWANNGLVMRDENRVFPIDPTMLGIELDAPASANAALNYGRTQGGIGGSLRAVLGSIDVSPVIRINTAVTEQALRELTTQIEIPPTNAGVQVVNGIIEPRAAVDGRALDLAGTLAPLEANAAVVLADGELELAMFAIDPEITDPSPIVAAASTLLANPLEIRAYDPVSDDTEYWTLMPDTWVEWLTAVSDPDQPLGLALSLDDSSVRGYLGSQQQQLGESRYIDLDESINSLQNAIARSQTTAYVRVYHHDVEHVVQSGETIISIAYDYGIPYPYVQDANGGIDAVSVGQTITLPSHDVMLPMPVTFEKRIVVNMSEQRVRVYEDGELKWDWIASTGIQSSPTWPGIYQIISHETNAYAANWDLWMPNFMGVYRPIPGSDFTNGFHGFPTRGGSQLLWTNSLGTRVTYGCILLSDENIQTLYDWAEEGVIVEIQS